MRKNLVPTFKASDKEEKTKMIKKENEQASNLRLADVQLAFQSVLQMRSLVRS